VTEVTTSRAGFGKTGYCKLCASDIEPELNKRLKADWKAPAIQEWMGKFTDSAGKPLYANRQTIYAHKAHITSAKDKVVSFAAKAQANPVIKTASNRQFLEAVRDIGMQRAITSPDEISISDALKAVQIMENGKQQTGDVYYIMAQVMTGVVPQPSSVVDGEAVEV
jgi:hypothetical protein